MRYELDLTGVSPRKIVPLSPGFRGRRPDGQTLSFTNYYMELGGAPFYGVSGEIHFSRLWEGRWEDALLKMKAGGVNIVSTYIFWIHHEEVEGEFDFTGRRDLRRFVELCGRLGLAVIVRLGPFDHGECRNGGLPDWLYGKPFEVRSLDEGFLACTRRLYRRIARELQGLYYKDGGPIIAAQLDNEYMHAGAPWEITAGTTGECLPSGTQGGAYLLRLRDIAREEGIDVPFYTCTAWGGAAAPEELMPLWSGYAYRPWLFYDREGEHPATEEYLYRDNHNGASESKPYLCCEMGGGMFCSYRYRFQLDYKSVDAMANIKLGSGCNMLGYYMFHGGTHPAGKRTPFLNEGQVPKRSYDFQAALGEFGQVRESFRRLRALHLLASSFGEVLCKAKTVLPEGAQDIAPEDMGPLRFAVRVDENGAGFLFLNNFQDHAETRPRSGDAVALRLPGKTLVFDRLSLAAGENCVLPFGLDVCGIPLLWATAQPLATLEADGERYAFFFAPEGMTPRYAFASGLHEDACFTVEERGRRVHFVTLSREQSLRFGMVEAGGRRAAVLCDGVALGDGERLLVQHDAPAAAVCVFPNGVLPLGGAVRDGEEGVFTRYRLEREAVSVEPAVRRVGPSRYVVDVPGLDFAAAKEILLQIRYTGDVGSAFLDGELISDNFCNGDVWEIGLREFAARLREHPLTVIITRGALESVSARAVYEWALPFSR